MCGLGIDKFGDLVMTPKYMPDTDPREFLSAVSPGKYKGEFASVLTGSWQHSPYGNTEELVQDPWQGRGKLW